MPPYRLIFSGDVKIYENLDALPRAFLVHDWQAAGDTAAAVAAMRGDDFEPGLQAVVIGESVPLPPASGRGSVAITDYRPEAVTLRVEADAESLLILTDSFYPGWEAAIDGVPAPVWPVDGLFRGVFVPAGEHEIVMSFRPEGYRRGVLLSVVGILALLAVGILVYRRYDKP